MITNDSWNLILEVDSKKDSMNQFKLLVQMNLFEFLINDSFVSWQFFRIGSVSEWKKKSQMTGKVTKLSYHRTIFLGWFISMNQFKLTMWIDQFNILIVDSFESWCPFQYNIQPEPALLNWSEWFISQLNLKDRKI